jgi:hypothetical protein
MLLGTTLLLTQVFRFSVLQAAAGIAPGPLTAAIGAPFSGLSPPASESAPPS